MFDPFESSTQFNAENKNSQPLLPLFGGHQRLLTWLSALIQPNPPGVEMCIVEQWQSKFEKPYASRLEAIALRLEAWVGRHH